jgi:hypothetical protein
LVARLTHRPDDEAVGTPETPVNLHHNTRRNIREDHRVQLASNDKIKLLVNNELKIVPKEEIVTQFIIVLQHSHGGTEEDHKNSKSG